MSSNGTAERLMSEAQETATKLSELAAQVEAAQREVANAEGAFDHVERALKNRRITLDSLEASVTLQAILDGKIDGKNETTRTLQTKVLLDNDAVIQDTRRDVSDLEANLALAHNRCADAEAVAKAIYHQLQALQSKASLQVAMLNLFTATIAPMNLERTEVIPVKMPPF